jgi:hypothetical protein
MKGESAGRGAWLRYAPALRRTLNVDDTRAAPLPPVMEPALAAGTSPTS